MKNKIIYWLKLILLIWPPVAGYSFLYLLAWVRLGLPQEWWVTPLVVALAALSGWAFLKWVGRWGDDD